MYIDADRSASQIHHIYSETIFEPEKSGLLVASRTEIEKKLTKEELEAYMKIEFLNNITPFDRLPIMSVL